MALVDVQRVINDLRKAPPGLKPKRFGPHVIWSEKRRRWVDGRVDQDSTQETSAIKLDKRMVRIIENQARLFKGRVAKYNLNLSLLKDRWEKLGKSNEDYTSDVVSKMNEIYGEHDYQEVLSRTMQNSSVYMAIPIKALDKIFESGVFKNSAQSLSGLGVKYAGKSAKAEVSIKRRFELVEKPILGINNMDDLDLLPKYGFLASKEQMDNKKMPNTYGPIKIQFKDDVKNQGTFTLDDTWNLNVGGWDICPPSSMANLNTQVMAPLIGRKALDIHKNDKKGLNLLRKRAMRWVKSGSYKDLQALSESKYLEVQLYGSITTNQISRIWVQTSEQQELVEKLLHQHELSDISIGTY